MTPADGATPGELSYLYMGTDDVDASLSFYTEALGARFVWRFRAFATDVAAVRFGPDRPFVLLAEHRPTPSCLPIWSVPNLDDAVATLARAGFADHGETVGTPDGPVHVVTDPSGNELGLLRPDRPGALEQAYADPTNTNAVRGV
jgi:catechol 2,3-dioxygenase-like lactoylglutathione lyase family enzyme